MLILKALAITVLFFIFFLFFGMSSIKKFMMGDTVMVTRSKPNKDGLPAPAIMVCPINENGVSWKLNKSCEKEESLVDVEDCIKENSYHLDETINHFNTGMSFNHDSDDYKLISNNLWRKIFVSGFYGICYTLSYRKLMKSSDILYLSFGSKPKNIKVFLYDPRFFLFKSDSFFVPFILMNKPNQLVSLLRTSISRMNRPQQFECNPDENYNYNQCVRKSLSIKMGCNYPWDMVDTKNNYQTCNTTSQLQQYWKLLYPKMYYANPKELTNLTGCQLPCHYIQFSVVGTPEEYDIKGSPLIELSYTSTDLTSSREVWLYPFDSLVSEFGGALGLFLGFSFLGLLDVIQSLFKCLASRLGLNQVTHALPDVI